MNRAGRAVSIAAAAAGLVLGGVGIAAAVDGNGKGDNGKIARQSGSRISALAASSRPEPQETLFVPITQCRVADSRIKGGKIGSGGRSFYVGGTAKFADQGGTAGGCGVPATATAVAVNLVATRATSAGMLRAWPAGSTPPSGSVLYYGTTTTANELPISIRPGTSTGLSVTASSPTDLIVDVTGYYVPQLAAYVNSDGTLYSSTSRAVGSERVSTGYYRITFDRQLGKCAASVAPGLPNHYATTVTNDNYVEVNTWVLSGTTQVPTDSYFNVTATC